MGFNQISRTTFWLLRNLLRLRYKVQFKNTELLKMDKPRLYLPNHQALIDPIVLVSFVFPYDQLVPVLTSKYYDSFVANWFFKRWGAVRVSDLEKGSRNINVLDDILSGARQANTNNKSVVVYPSGQITRQARERIFNKKAAHALIGHLPSTTAIIGVKITGLWGSMWSAAKNGKSPNFSLAFLKGLLYVFLNLILFVPRRKITIEFVEISSQARKEARKGRKEFNAYLESLYNNTGDYKYHKVKYLFYS